MKSHELAKFLLNAPDITVGVHTINGFEKIEKIEIETETTRLVTQSQGYDIDGPYKIVPSSNYDPWIMLISKSFGAV